MIEIRIDEPGAGEWIMERAGGHYVPFYSHSLSSHDGDQILGGFVLTDYIRRASAVVSMAGEAPGWCNRTLLMTLFAYAFRQLGIRKLFALIRSDNERSIALCMRVGWKVETVIHDVYPDGVHGVLLYMTEATCRWLPTYRRSSEKADLLNTTPMLCFEHDNADAA